MPVPTPHLRGRERAFSLSEAALTGHLPPMLLTLSMSERQNPKSYRWELPQRVTSEQYYFCALAIASISTCA